MPEAINDLTEMIIGAAIRVHTKYGPGLLESVYNLALALELVALGLEVEVGKPVALEHEGVTINRAYVVDLVVNKCVVIELKCADKLTEVHTAQLLTYLRLMDIRVGLLINFNVAKLAHGIRRVVNRHVDANGNLLPPPRRSDTVEEVKKAVDEEQEK